MTAGPYDSPEQHLADTVDVMRLVLAAALQRRSSGDGGGNATDTTIVAQLRQREGEVEARASASPPVMLPLELLRRAFELSPTEVRVITALAAFELQTHLRTQARQLMADPQRGAPDVGLLGELIYGGRNRQRLSEELGSDGRLARFALVKFDRISDTPFALRRARVAERVLDILHGRDAIEAELARFLDRPVPVEPDELVLEPGRLAEVRGLCSAAVDATAEGRLHPVIVLTGREGAGRKAILGASARMVGLSVLRVRCASLPRDEASIRVLGPSILREAIWARALIVLDGADQLAIDNAGFQLDEALLGSFPWPVAAVVDRITTRPPQMSRGTVIVELGIPSESAREELWRRKLGNSAPADVPVWAAERYAVTPGIITQAAQSARAKAAARDAAESAVAATDVHEGLRTALDAKLGTLGTRISWRQNWSDLVLPDDSVAEVREFIARIRHRRKVYESWGFGRKVAKGMGLSALFCGPPGTGKTMVAGLIAEELKLDLYQVDISKVVSKWIGETEKNLGGLFDAAEAGHAILLFDEADSLFAKRTQVQSSNDRYANLEVNYLLQRMEAFSGVTILTTNNETAVDEAFTRRLSLKVDFPVPEADERERLWRAMMPAEASLAADIDYRTLAHRFEMTGGYIKNAAVRAAFLAADENSPIAMKHLIRAARGEYQAMGKITSHL